MKIRQVIENATLTFALALLAAHVPAQSFHIVSQEGYAAASAFLSGPEGSSSDSEQNDASETGPIFVLADANVSLEGMSGSATASLAADFAPTFLMLSGTMNGNAAVSNSIEQSAGATGAALLRTVFTVDAPAFLTLTGETQSGWSGDATVETNIVLSSATQTLADLSGIQGTLAFEGVLQPGETYTLTAYGLANAPTSSLDSFPSAQGSFNLNLALQAVPAPGALLTALIGMVPGVTTLLLHRRRRRL